MVCQVLDVNMIKFKLGTVTLKFPQGPGVDYLVMRNSYMNEETKNDSDRTEELIDIVEEERLVYTMILRLDLIDVFCFRSVCAWVCCERDIHAKILGKLSNFDLFLLTSVLQERAYSFVEHTFWITSHGIG